MSVSSSVRPNHKTKSSPRHPAPSSANKDGSSTSLIRAFAILELIAQKSGGLTNSEISRRLNMATSTSSYILSRLVREGYIVREPEHGRYEIGLKVIALAHGALREMGLRRVAEPVLHRLAEDTGYSGLIGVLERGLMMIVDKVERPDLAGIDMDIGVRYPAHTTALGRVLLAHLPPVETAGWLDRFSMVSDSRKGIVSRSAFLRELENVKKNGYAISDGELFLGIRAIAAPVFSGSGRVRAAVSVTGHSKPVDDSELITYVTRAAKLISSRLATAESIKLPRR